jgi:hypothetical protein
MHEKIEFHSALLKKEFSSFYRHPQKVFILNLWQNMI